MHEIAKLILEHAGTVAEREEAVRTALYMGMPLNEIEEYLDWLDAIRGGPSAGSASEEDREDEAEGHPPDEFR